MSTVVPQPIERLEFPKPPADLIEAIIMATPRLLDGGRAYADYINGSYRGFNVGNGSLATDERGNYFAVYGANYKASKDSETMCSERLTTYRGNKSGLYIHSYHVDAGHQPDTQSGEHYPTTHSCGLCRHNEHTFKNEAVDPNATVVTRKKGTFLHQVFSAIELELMHTQPETYREIGQDTISDASYGDLTSEALARYEMLQTDVPDKKLGLSPASVLRICWLGEKACILL
jgi:hypothetical protein